MIAVRTPAIYESGKTRISLSLVTETMIIRYLIHAAHGSLLRAFGSGGHRSNGSLGDVELECQRVEVRATASSSRTSTRCYLTSLT
jgi:hypothetical protein